MSVAQRGCDDGKKHAVRADLRYFSFVPPIQNDNRDEPAVGTSKHDRQQASIQVEGRPACTAAERLVARSTESFSSRPGFEDGPPARPDQTRRDPARPQSANAPS